jgi:hypothetical protein
VVVSHPNLDVDGILGAVGPGPSNAARLAIHTLGNREIVVRSRHAFLDLRRVLGDVVFVRSDADRCHGSAMRARGVDVLSTT